MPDKKYLIEIPDMPDGSGVWDADKWERNKDKFMQKYPTANVFELGSYDPEDMDDNDQFMLTFDDDPDASGVWDAAKWERNKDKFLAKYPEARVNRVRYMDYWGDKAKSDQARMAELQQPDEERNARLAEMGYYDDSAGMQVDYANALGLSPLSSAIEQNSVSGEVTYLDPRVEEFFANDTEYTDRQMELNRLRDEYEANPRVIEQREYEAQMARYAEELEKQIKADMEADVDAYHAGRGAAAKHMQDASGANQTIQAIRMLKGEDVGKDVTENEKQERYASALKLLQQAKDARDVAGKGMAGGVADTAKDWLRNLGTQSDIEMYNEVGNILTALEQKVGNLNEVSDEVIEENLTNDEKALIRAFFEYNAAMADAGEDMSIWYKGGKIFAESIPFMMEFLVTGGLANSAGRAATSWMGKGFAKWIANSAKGTAARAAKKVAAKTVSGVAKTIVAAGARTLVAPTTYKNIAEQSVQYGEDGHLDRDGNMVKAAVDSYIEQLSEMSGAAFGKVLGGVGRLALGKTAFEKVGAWFGNNAVMQNLSKLGFHGLPEEVGEEIFGNALRTITGVDEEALSRMFEKDEFASMIIGFAPMTLLGAGMSMAKMGAVSIGAANAGRRMRQDLSRSYTEEQIDQVEMALDEAKDANEIANAIRPIIMGMQAAGAPLHEVQSVWDYAIAVAKKKAMVSAQSTQEMQLAQAKIDEAQERMGGRFWIENKDGVKSVKQVVLNNGKTAYVVSEPDQDGRVAIINAVTGQKGTALPGDIKEESWNGTLNAFGTGLVMADRTQREQQRMQEERTAQVNEVRNRLGADPRINVGTEGSPIYVVTQSFNDAGVRYVAQDGSVGNMSWEQAADSIGMPIVVKTDAQIAQEEAEALVAAAAERRAKRAKRDAVGAAERDNAVVDAENAVEGANEAAKHIPMNDDGTVNEAAFWEQNPEEYVKWNDEQNQDGGQDSLQQVAIAKQELMGLLQEANAAQNTSNPTTRKAAKKEVERLADRIARLDAIEQSYAQALEEEQAAVQQTAATPTSSMSEEDLESMDAQYQGILGKTRVQGERVRVMQEYLDKLAEGSVPVVLLTRQNYEEKLKEGGLPSFIINKVKQQVDAGKPVAGFMARGKVYLMEDGLSSIEEARVTYVHERQHTFNSSNPQLVQRVANALGNEESALAILKSFVKGKGIDSYKDDDLNALADEIICRSMEIAYTTEDFSVDLQSRGIPSEVISIIAEIDNEQRQDQSLSHARRRSRRNSHADVSGAGSVREDGRDFRQVSEGVLEQEETRPSGASGRGTQIGEGGEPGEVNASDDENAPLRIAEEAELDPETILNEDGFEADEQNEDVRFSVRYLPTLEQREGIIDSIIQITGRTKEEAERWLESELSLVPIVLNDKEYLDYAPDSKYKAIKDNSDYPQGTVDFNNICRKRKDFTMMYTRLQRAYPNRIFTAEDLADIRTIMSEDGLVVACGLCYVEDRRQKLGDVADEFIKDLQDGFKSYGKKNATKRANAEKFRSFVGADTYVPSIYDLITLEGSDKLHDEHKGIWDAFGAYNRARGQQTQYTFQGYAEYKREILTWSDAKVKKVNSLGGLRIFSYSDFEAHHLLDIIQIIIDCAARGVMIQGYTKVPEFARVVEKTGIKLNRSLIPLGDTGIVDGKLAYDPVEGIDINDPNFLESNDNVGNILIGINDEQIRMAMADPFIHFIIPYHARQAGNIRAKLNVGAWTNYIDTQNERKMSDGKRVDKNINIYTDVLNESITKDREFVEKYLEVCREKGFIPKFDQFLDRNAEGNYIYTPGYYKFLVDFKLFDEAGNILPQKPVVAQFDDAFNAQVLLDYAREERETAGEAMNSTYDKIVETLDLGEPTVGEDVRFRASEGTIDILEEARKVVEREDGVAFRVISQENYDMAERIISNLAGRPYFQRVEGEYELGKLASNYAELADIIMAIDANGNYTPVGTALLGFFAENPDMHFPLLFNDSAVGKETSKAFAEELSKVNDPFALYFMKEAWKIHKGSLEQAGLGVKPSSTTKYNKAIDARAEEIKAAEVKGTAFNFKKQESSLDEIDAIFKQLNKDEDLALLHDRVMNVARTLGVKVSFAGKRGSTAGESLGDKVSYDYKFFNSPAVPDQNKCNTITHELIHSVTVYAIYLRSKAPVVLSDGMLEAVDILHDVYNQIARDPAFKGEYGVTDVYEMVAELSNAQFRDKLKEKNLFQRILDALKRLLGIDTVKEDSAYQVLSDTLNYIIDNYDQAAFDAYALYASKSKSYGRMMKIEEAPRFRITPEQDKAYMDAVEAGDMETAQRMVVEAARLAMPNTKVVDENGNPKVVYHGTGSKFYTFRNTSDSNELGAGYYFSDSYEMAERYATDENLADNRERLEDRAFDIFVDEMGLAEEDFDNMAFLDDYNEAYARAVQRMSENGHVKSVFLNLETPRILSRNSPDYDPYLQYGFNHYNEGQMAKRFNDGVIDEMFEERHKGLTGTQYVAFRPSQIKSADPVTYDNDGNVIPLSERFNPENTDIRFRVRTEEEREKLFEDAKKHYGVTKNFNAAGYMLPDGSLLDFSEANDGGDPNSRSLDHRDIEGIIMDNGVEYDSRWMYIADFMNEGAIRLLPESAGINMIQAPTEEQRKKIFDFIYKYNGEVILEINDERLNSVAYMEYDRRTSPSRIFRDIDGYFNNGIVPQQDIRFRMSNNNQAIFVSNAARAVEGIKQEKATPEQWLKMIEKAGGLKAGEDKWMGLSDWLKASKAKTLTKAEVLDYINENMIVIEEQHYDINAEDDAERAHSEITEKLQDRFDHYEDEYYQEHDWDGETEDARAYAIEKLREEMGDTFPYTIELEYGNVYLTFPYEEEDDLVVWAQKTGVEYTPGVAPINETRLNYTTDGLENKHEIALTIPTIESWNRYDDTHFGDAGEGRAIAWIRFGETEVGTPYPRAEFDAIKAFEEENGVDIENWSKEQANEYRALFAAFKKAQANKHVLVIDEIQSKRHQEGREKGYKPDWRGRKKLRENLEKADREVERIEAEMIAKYGSIDKIVSSQDFDALEAAKEARREARFEFSNPHYGAIPDAPFDKNWHELAMKRMLRYAAENGYDAIAWTKGDQQAERYNIGDVVTSVDYRLNEDGSYHVDTMGRNGYQMDEIPTTFGSETELAEIFGKEIAKKIAGNLENDKKAIVEADKEIGELREWFSENVKTDESDLDSIFESAINNPEQSERWTELEVKKEEARRGHSLSETDFRIGGEGMKGFYDKMLPAFMNKYGKKWGVKVEDIDLSNLEDGLTMHSVPVTEEMKASVMEGQVMFRVRGENESAEEFVNGVIEDFKSKYTAFNDIVALDPTSKEQLADFIGMPVNKLSDEMMADLMDRIEERDSRAWFNPDTKRIAIFVRENVRDGKKSELVLIHENIHAINKKHNELIAIGEYLWNSAKEGTREYRYKTAITEAYPESEWFDEMSAYVVSEYIQDGEIDVLKGLLDAESTELLDKLLKYNGNGKERARQRPRISWNVLRERPSDKSEESRDEGGEGQSGDLRFRSTEITPEVRDEMDVIAATAIVNGNYMKAPNGADTNLTPEQWAMVRTKNFREWFGDWENDPGNASKVVDENGEPKVVFHGGAWRPLLEEKGNAVFKMRGGLMGKGAYFTDTLSTAIDYAREKYGWEHDEEVSDEFLDDNGYITEVFLNIRNEDNIREYYGETYYLATNPSQIKSATGNTGEFADGEGDIRFSIRTKPAPEKTGIGYKVFYLKDGKLYPPMVANQGGVNTPVGVWLDAEEGTRAGESKTGRPQVKQGGKGTQGGSGKLAYRPGWHLGEIPYALQFNRKDESGEKTLFPADFVWAEVEYANDVDYQEEAMSYGYNANGKFQHSLAGLPKLPTDGSYRYRTNPNPETDPWIITGAMKVNRLLTPSEVDQMVIDAGREPQKRQEGAVTDEQIETLNESFDIRYRVNENPTDAQKEAGNYKMGHLNLDGYRITIENPKGSVRRGTDSNGNTWENTLNNDYGYIRGTEGVDGDHIDVYLSDNPSEGNVFVIDQVNPSTREFDEHKVMYGFNSAEEAREAYLANYSEGWNGLGTITEVTKDEFKKWIESSHRKTKPFIEYKSVKAIGAQSEAEEAEDDLLPSTGTPTDEVVASGLDLSPTQTAELAGNIFAALPEESRKKITEGLNGNILGLQDAIMQIPASLAMKENWNETDKELASVVREKVQDIVDSKDATSRPLTTKEALWMLHDSDNSPYDLVSAARNAIVARNLGFDPESIRRKKDVDDYIRFRAGGQGMIDAAIDMYNYETSLWTERLKESWFDMNQSVVALQNAMAQASGMAIEPWENIVYALNRLSSKSYADKKKYLRDFLNPLWDAVMDVIKGTDLKVEDVERYMMLKHALERNLVFAKRDAREFYRGMYDEVARKMKSQSHAEQVVALSEAKKALADIDAQIATATGKKLQRLQEERMNAQYKVEVANLVLRGDEKQNENDLQAYYDAIDAELDPKYLEFREKDYGGLTSMYTSYGTVNRSNYKSEEAYQQAVLSMQQPIYDKVADMESAARMEVDDFERRLDTKDLWDKVNAATKETLRHQYESGMLTIEQYEAVRDMFKYYVPLRGFADNTAEDMYSYYMNNSSNGFSMPVIGAKGRKTRAESPLGWIGTMAESAIQADNKNEAKMCLYYAILRRPDQNLLSITDTWFEYSHTKNGKKVYKPAYPPKTDRVLNADELRQHMEDWEKDMKSKQAQGKAFKGTQAVNLRGSVIFQDDKQEKEHIVRVKVAGKDYSILINGNPRAAQAINGLLNPDANVGPVEEWIEWARRGLSSLLTSFSPLFWVANYQRDILSSVERTSESDDIAEAFKYANNRRKAWRVASYLYKMENGTLGNSYYENLYKEFAENGGITGYTALTSNKEYEKLLADYAKEVRNPSVIKWAKKVFSNFISFGEAIEQVSRFAAFVTARESGKSLEEAIYAAKEVSVNFNRKGSAQPISRDELEKLRTKRGEKLNGVQKIAAIVLSAMPKYLKWAYFFFNASVQAISSKIKLTKKRPGMAAAWAGAYFGMSIAMAWINYLLGDDDDEYLDLPDYLRHSTVLIKVSDEYYFKWSIPQEMRPFYAWGDMIVSKAMGKMPHKNLGTEMALAAAQWLPVNPFEAEDPLLSLVPDVASPIVEAVANKTSFGGKIYDDMAFKSEGTVQDIPAYRKATDKTGKVYVELAEILNAISGGDEVQKGWANINPAALEHLVEGYGGGIYDFAKMMVTFPGMVLDAVTGEKEMEIKNIPFVNKVVMSVDETNMYSHTNDAFYHYKEIAESAKRIEKEYAESDNPERAEAYRKEEDWRIYLLYKQYEEDFKDVKERLDNAVDDTETDLLKQEQNVLREMFLNDIAKGELPEITFEIREDIKRIEKDVKKIMKPADDANKERLEMKKAGDLDGMLRAIERRDSLKDTPEYQRAEEISKEVKAIKKRLNELGSVERRSQRDSVLGELQRNYDKLKERMSTEISELP